LPGAHVYEPIPEWASPRYNHAMSPRVAISSPAGFIIWARSFASKLALPFVLLLALLSCAACTFNGDRPARAFSEATGGEDLERVFWKQIKAANWVEIERALASNYAGITPAGALDRETALAQYRTWQLKEASVGDLKTELNGNTIVVTYTITLNGTASTPSGSQPLPSAPQHMMTVWQQQKSGWVEIAHSVSQP
jgi:hypothetical protein